MACLATTGFAAAGELAPATGHSIHLGRFTGAIYYTMEEDGYRVVATLASGPEDSPIRFVSTLGSGHRMLISVPQGVGEPSLEFEVVRYGDALLVSEPADLAGDTADMWAVR
jgi:hypothetical protein